MKRRQSPSRAGFTLIEVLIAVSIVALLVALLLPAVKGAYRKAQEAQVSAELNNLATALANFKNTYGDYPPAGSSSARRATTSRSPPGRPSSTRPWAMPRRPSLPTTCCRSPTRTARIPRSASSCFVRGSISVGSGRGSISTVARSRSTSTMTGISVRS